MRQLPSPRRPSRAIVIVVRDPITPDGLAELCDRVRIVLASRATRPVVCDVSALSASDALALEAVARIQLTARRLGLAIPIHHAGGSLRDLLDFVGLSDALAVVAESGVDANGQPEDREHPLVDEEVDTGDAIT